MFTPYAFASQVRYGKELLDKAYNNACGKKNGSKTQIWLRVMILTYEKEIPSTIIATA